MTEMSQPSKKIALASGSNKSTPTPVAATISEVVSRVQARMVKQKFIML